MSSCVKCGSKTKFLAMLCEACKFENSFPSPDELDKDKDGKKRG